MGHVLYAGRISANLEKVEKMRDWPIPTNAEEVHSFLGFASYYHRCIPNFVWMAYCLHKLVGLTSKTTKKGKGQKKERIVA